MVLTANDTIAYKYPTTTLLLAKSANSEDIAFKTMMMHLLAYLNDDITIRAVNRELKELVNENDFKKYYENKVKIIEEKNKEIEQKLNEERNKQFILHKITKVFIESRAFSKKFIGLPNNTILYAYAFRQVSTRYSNSFYFSCSNDQKLSSSSNLNIY